MLSPSIGLAEPTKVEAGRGASYRWNSARIRETRVAGTLGRRRCRAGTLSFTPIPGQRVEG
jgi:hypothetical protein